MSGAERPALLPHHAALIAASVISGDVARARGYRSVTTRADLERAGFAPAQRLVPTLLIPIYGVTGELVSCQHRPDSPRIVGGRVFKYESVKGSRMVLDVPPPARPWLGDPARPLFITEGVRKADSAVSHGLCCLALLGVWNWRGTNGHGGKVALPDWESVALNGRTVCVVFDSDVMGKREVHAALARLKAFLESRGAHVLVIYLPSGPGGMKQGLDDFFADGRTPEDLLALATDELRRPQEEPAQSRDAGPYRVEAGHICRDKPTRDGTITEPLCNFTAAVTEELLLDDGAEPARVFIVEGRLDTGAPLPPARVPAARFQAMNWITDHWGLRAIVRAGLSTRDALREAIQRLSPEARRRHVFTHSGWREIAGGWGYLTGGGAVGHDGIEVNLGPELTRYRLPQCAQDPLGAMRQSVGLLRVAPLRVTVPLWAAVYRAPLASAYPVDASLWLEAETGALKSTLAALMLAHYGDFDRTHLPGTWSSTANQLERRAFVLKDALFVIDDYAPTGMDARELELKATRLLRAQGNLAGRGRLRSDLSDRPAFPPRGLILSTGEQHPPGQSVVARMLLVETRRGEVNLAALTAAQQQHDRLAHAMAGYLAWLAPEMATLPGRLARAFEDTRAKATADGHLRVPEALAHFWIGLDCALGYAEEIRACSASEAEDLRDEGWAALLDLGRAQGRLVETERPSRRFLSVLLALVTQRKAVLLSRDDAGEDFRPGLDLLGWQDDEALYFIPEAAFGAVSRACREAGEPFPVRSTRLLKDLAEERLSECDADRHTTTAKIGGRSKRVLKLTRAAVAALLGEDFPSPLVTAVTGSAR
ncbi:MAG: DUF3854 domain-containing protein [Candidatus Rokubacteria bacterium]|nr:DUF3854 domain-containing protein [Candidatus Rokubacteria bacterium]